MNQDAFPSRYNWLALAPLGALLISWLVAILFDGSANGVIGSSVLAISVAVIGSLIFLYMHQVRYIKRVYPTRKLRPQYLLIGSSLLAVMIGAAIGDISGSIAFSDTPEFLGSGMLVAALGIPLATICLYGCVIGNLLFIKTKGVNSLLHIARTTAYVIGWLLAAAAAFFAYLITYTLHDPSTE